MQGAEGFAALMSAQVPEPTSGWPDDGVRRPVLLQGSAVALPTRATRVAACRLTSELVVESPDWNVSTWGDLHFSKRLVVIVAVTLHFALALDARAVYWNADPAFGVASANGLTDRVQWFQNTHVIYNQTNSSRGTATLLNSEWAITVRHVVQNGGNYSQIAAPGQIRLDVLGTQYFGDQIFTPDGGSEIALVHLAGNVPSALDAVGTLNSAFDEGNRIVHIGGYGLWGQFNTTGAGGTVPGTSSNNISFHRGYNIPWVPGQIQIISDGEQTLENLGLLEGIAGSGDSGGPMWGFYGSDFATQASDMQQWRLGRFDCDGVQFGCLGWFVESHPRRQLLQLDQQHDQQLRRRACDDGPMGDARWQRALRHRWRSLQRHQLQRSAGGPRQFWRKRRRLHARQCRRQAFDERDSQYAGRDG